MADAARIAVATVRAHRAEAVEEVRFVLFGEDAYAAFTAELAATA
jgi:O-acetyl-ADP-ribose deacetylase (regulator of RNase III)